MITRVATKRVIQMQDWNDYSSEKYAERKADLRV